MEVGVQLYDTFSPSRTAGVCWEQRNPIWNSYSTLTHVKEPSDFIPAMQTLDNGNPWPSCGRVDCPWKFSGLAAESGSGAGTQMEPPASAAGRLDIRQQLQKPMPLQYPTCSHA